MIVKYMLEDQEHYYPQGVPIGLGDTLKFGRVRYKIIMVSNRVKGCQKFDLNDRF
jgi:hypothetical protein